MSRRHPAIVPDCASEDIAWAAGIIEGEGSFAYRDGTLLITVGQKDGWLPGELRRYFGGSVAQPGKQKLYRWTLSGPRARGLAEAIRVYLSPRRQAQLDRALHRGVLATHA